VDPRAVVAVHPDRARIGEAVFLDADPQLEAALSYPDV
jgi:hypothetical protein